MNKNVTRIALTGGPCAGKTTALVQIINHFSALGYLVYTLPETPTLFNTASVNFATPDKHYFYNIEKAVMKFQLQMEDVFLNLVRSATSPVILLSDRGTMDISAYMERTLWQAMLDELGLTEVMIRDARYDAVIHMVTAANGAEEFYTTENNNLRMETIEQARALDVKLIEAWTGHQNLRIIENNKDFEAKIQQTIDAIAEVVGERTDLNCKRRFLVELTGEIPFGVESEIYQAYIPTEDGSSLRIRKRGIDGSFVYFVSRKGAPKTKVEDILTERQISPEEYLFYLNSSSDELSVIHKIRTNFVWAKQYFTIDRFLSPENIPPILEIKCRKDAEVKFPPYVKLIKDVSGDPLYERI